MKPTVFCQLPVSWQEENPHVTATSKLTTPPPPRCSLREPPGAKHSSTSSRSAGRAKEFHDRSEVKTTVFCRLSVSRQKENPYVAATSKLTTPPPPRCSLREPPGAKHSLTSLRSAGRAKEFHDRSEVNTAVFCRLSVRQEENPHATATSKLTTPLPPRCSRREPPGAKHSSTSLRSAGRAREGMIGVK